MGNREIGDRGEFWVNLCILRWSQNHCCYLFLSAFPSCTQIPLISVEVTVAHDFAFFHYYTLHVVNFSRFVIIPRLWTFRHIPWYTLSSILLAFSTFSHAMTDVCNAFLVLGEKRLGFPLPASQLPGSRFPCSLASPPILPIIRIPVRRF